MAQVTHFFAGANSGAGFQNFFPRMLDRKDTYDWMLLKGGPGVGKATFMRTVGQSMEKAGTPVEYLWCSGDPDSLDGVILPELRCGIVDATPPHCVEPRYPAAVDRIVDLGRFYDVEALKAKADMVRAHTQRYQAAYVRAYRALKAARELELETVSLAGEAFDRARAERRGEGIIRRELSQRGSEEGRTDWRFLGSLTHRGYVWRFDSVGALCSRVYELKDRYERSGAFLERCRQAAVDRGWNVIACGAPEEPGRLEHLLIPGLDLAFVTTHPEMSYPGTVFRKIHVDELSAPMEKGRLRLQTRLVKALREEGVMALKAAKEGHDELEKVYNPHVDFEGVRTLAGLETGRLLNWRERPTERD